MATDRARRSYDASRMYRSVVSQQGRVTLEADSNEAEEIRATEARAALIDVIGPTGSPDDGYRITVPANLADYDVAIGGGVIYVGGVRVETHATTYLGQKNGDWRDYELRTLEDVDRAKEPYPNASGRELFYLEVIEQEVTAVEDPALREVAIGGPDTAARTRMLRRVHRRPVNAGSCEDAFAELLTTLTGGQIGGPFRRVPPARRPLPMTYDFNLAETVVRAPAMVIAAIPAPTAIAGAGAAAASTLPSTSQLVVPNTRLAVAFVPGAGSGDPCQPAAQSGFLGVENQLIRVQIAAGGTTFLWANDNASFLYRATVDANSSSKLKLHAEPVDDVHYPRPNQWVELLVNAVVLDNDGLVASRVGRPVQVASYDPIDRTLTLQGDAAGLPNELFVRVWENRQAITAGPIELESANSDHRKTGVQVTITGTAFPGDHWMIGLRPGVVANDASAIYPARLRTPQPPDGPRRWVVSLAVVDWSDPHAALVSDCRKPFRPLTEDDDLAFHNRHLHGWGVVCGLQVACPPLAGAGNLVRPEEMVIVRDGYAIHPSGDDIRVDTVDGESRVALGDLAVAEGGLKRTNGKVTDGAVSLWIDRKKRFHADPYDPAHKRTWLERLKGTMLGDVLTDCVMPLWEFAKSQLLPAPGEGLVGPAARRRIALINLFWQVAAANAQDWNAERVYLSGAPGPQDEAEDKILRALFDALKKHLEPTTFCAMFDDIAYPGYDVYRSGLSPNAARPTTIFGTGRHHRVRIDEPRRLALSCGGDNRIDLYDLATYQFLDSVAFPIAGAEVKDVAFSLDGNDLYAIAATGATTSVFAQGTIGADKKLQWRAAAPHPVPAQLATLVVDRKGRIFASAVGDGAYELTPGANPTHELRFQFYATGHLAVGRFNEDTVVYAGETEKRGDTEMTRVRGMEVQKRVTHYYALPNDSAGKPGHGRDDLAALGKPSDKIDAPYAIIDGVDPNKRLVGWAPASNESLHAPGASPNHVVDLGPSRGSRIAYEPKTQTAMITYLDHSESKIYRLGDNHLSNEVHPLQIGPIAIASSPATASFYVLNLVSSTITAIPATRDGSTIDLAKLETYRRDAIAAYMKLVGRTVQFLKDCICHHFLIECPTDEGKVYLADVSFKDGKVYQICNFGHRKYVHSFPTVEYWLSLVPIIPLVKEQIEKVCCATVTEWFEALVSPVDAKKGDTVPKAGARAGLGWMLVTDLTTEYKVRMSQATVLGRTARAAVIGKLRPPIPEAKPAPVVDPAVDPVPDDARKLIESRGLVVRRTEVVDPRIAVELVTAPSPVRGDTVDLLTDTGGRVVGWRRVAPTAETEPAAAAAASAASAPASTAHADEVIKLRQELEGMHMRLASLEARFPHH